MIASHTEEIFMNGRNALTATEPPGCWQRSALNSDWNGTSTVARGKGHRACLPAKDP